MRFMYCSSLLVLIAVNLLVPLSAATSAAVDHNASTQRSAMEHYEYVQNLRREASKQSERKLTTPTDLKAAIKTLQFALAYLQKTEVHELAGGNVYLEARHHDVLHDMASAYVRLGEYSNALDALEAAQRYVTAPMIGKMMQAQSEFAPLLNEPRFKALIANSELVGRLWSTPNIATPYREKISVEERVAGLSLFWAEARAGFAHFANVPDIEWDKRYLEALTQVIAAETTADYYDVMMRFAPLLQDGHTNIYAPEELAEKFYSRPPIRTQKMEGKVVVTELRSPSLAKRLHVGDEVIEIDGLNVDLYAAERVAPYVSASTPQDKLLRTYSYQLFSGDAATPISLKLRNAAGEERLETVARTGYADAISRPQFQFRITPENIAYISIDHFESNEGVKAFQKALPEIMKAKALVIDIRRNGGGSSEFGLDILSYLTTKPIARSASHIRAESAFERARGAEWIQWGEVPDNGATYTKKRSNIFNGPVAVLIGPQTFSAAEDFLVSYDLMKRGLVIGEASGGSTGQPLSLKLPGGGSARICIKRDTYPDGKAFVGKGIAPNIYVKSTVADLRNGRDAVLERAIAELLHAARPTTASH